MKQIRELFIFVLILLNFTFIYTLNSNETLLLQHLSTDCGINWSTLDCSATGNGKSQVICDSTNQNIVSLSIQPPNTACVLRNEYNYLTQLKELYLYDVSVPNSLSTIQQHQTIEKLYYATQFPSTQSFCLSTSFNIPKLTFLHCYYCNGTTPTTVLPNTMTYYYMYENSLGLINSIPLQIFTSNLLVFYYAAFSKPISPTTLITRIFDTAVNLQSFDLFANDFTVDFGIFYQAPSSLTRIIIQSVKPANATFPAFHEVSWNSLEILQFKFINFIGNFDGRFLTDLYSLENLDLTECSGLQFSIPSSISSNKQIKSLNFEKCTKLTGTIPQDILEGKLEILNFKSTGLSGLLPSIFMCMPTDLLTTKFLFTSGQFSNYQGPGAPRTCNPIISSIFPSQLSSTDAIFFVRGTLLGTYTNYNSLSMLNSNGDSVSLSCQTSIVGKEISCLNPFIMGSGSLTLIVSNSQSTNPTTSFQFTYAKPIVRFVSPIPTVGGTVSIVGFNLFGDSTGSSIEIGSLQCTDLFVIIPYSSVTCKFGSGIDSGQNLKVSVKGNINDFSNQPKFNYKSPVVTSFSYIPPNTPQQLTITGTDFWNETSLVSVTIGTVSCPVKSVNDTILVCNYPPTVFSPGVKDVQVFVNGQLSEYNNLGLMIDPGYCPNSCGAYGSCSEDIGFCICQSNKYNGPECNQNSQSVSIDKSSDEPSFTISSSKDSTELDFGLVSIINNGNEIVLDDQDIKVTKNSDTLYTYQVNSQGIVLTVQLRDNSLAGNDSLGNSNILTYPSNSLTMIVQYSSSKLIDQLQFKFQYSISPEECDQPPIENGFPSGKTYGGTRFSTLIDFSSQWHLRFPLFTTVNENQYASISTAYSKSTDNSTQFLIATVSKNAINSIKFQYDFTLLDSVDYREPNIDECSSNSSNNKWKIGVGIGVPIGVILLGLGAAFLIRRQFKLTNTNKLLKQKLLEIDQRNKI